MGEYPNDPELKSRLSEYARYPLKVDRDTLLDLARRNKEPVSAVPTMINSWNGMCRDEGGGVGLAHGWHVIVAGKSGAGKSIFGLNLAVEAMEHGHGVAYLSLEMSKRQLLTRGLAIATNTPVRYLEPGDQYDETAFNTAAKEYLGKMDCLLSVNEYPIRTLDEIESAIREVKRLEKVRFVVVDYLQLAWSSNAESLTAQITEVSNKIRALAQELRIVTIGLSQYNRATSSSHDSPEMTGLMGGSSLENDADQVVLLDHTTYETEPLGHATQEISIAKNRHGSSGRIPIRWDYNTLKVMENV